MNIFLPISLGCSKLRVCNRKIIETVLLSTHNIMFWLRNKKIKFSLHTLNSLSSKSVNNEVCYTGMLFVCFDSLQHSQQFFSHVGTGLPQTSWV